MRAVAVYLSPYKFLEKETLGGIEYSSLQNSFHSFLGILELKLSWKDECLPLSVGRLE